MEHVTEERLGKTWERWRFTDEETARLLGPKRDVTSGRGQDIFDRLATVLSKGGYRGLLEISVVWGSQPDLSLGRFLNILYTRAPGDPAGVPLLGAATGAGDVA